VQFNSSVLVQINGDFTNNTGTVSNDGELYITGNLTNNAFAGGNGNYYLEGNWINNNNFNPGLSTVYLEGGTQNISGTVPTTFNNLTLLGTGIKNLQISASADGILALNDRELATGNNVMNILSTNLNSITRTSGFVSSTGNGYLLRAANLNQEYEFPVGSSVGTLRYRPVNIRPVSSVLNTYTVSFVNHDATSDGFNRALTDTLICAANPEFYHRINRTTGSTTADISVFYDEAADGLWSGMAQWNTSPSIQWESMAPATQTSATPLNDVTVTGWNDFSTDPYILTIGMPVVDLGPDTFVCDNSSIIIDAGTGYDSYAWSTAGSGQTITVTTAGTYYVTVTLQGCSATDSIKVILQNAPVADAGENMTICQGESILLTGAGGTYYLWSTTQTTQTITVSPTTTTTYYLTVSDNFCSDTDSVTVSVTPLPAASAGTDQLICIGDTVTLTATGGSIYEWNTGATTQIIQVIPSVTTTYWVSVTDNGCTAIDTVVVTVVTSVNANAGPDQSICEGDTVTLTATGGGSYLWSTADTTVSIIVTPLSTTIYYLTVSIGSCSNSDSVTVTVNPLPTADAGADQTICEGESVVLTATGGGSYLWNTSQTSASITVSPVTTTNFTVTVTLNGCSASDNVAVIVQPAPTAYAGADLIICAGDSVTLTATGGITYLWSNSAVTSTITVQPWNTTTYYVTVSDGNGCSASDGVTVTVNSIPNAFAGPDASMCKGDTLYLLATGGTSYQWYPNDAISNPYINNPYIFPASGTQYIVFVSNGTCTSSDTIAITVFNSPYVTVSADTIIYNGDDAQLYSIFNEDWTYSWTPVSSLNNSGIYNPVASPAGNTTYTVVVTDENGCTDSGHLTIYVVERPPDYIIIYNTFTPNGDEHNQYWIIENIEQYPDNTIQVFNRNGHIVFETSNYQNDWDGKYYGNDLPAATYYYIIDLGDGSDIYKGDITIIR
ncbi:MAG: gliding motility-associated C-terminal domain-containing protein, partial [Bacteroidota bacterium]